MVACGGLVSAWVRNRRVDPFEDRWQTPESGPPSLFQSFKQDGFCVAAHGWPASPLFSKTSGELTVSWSVSAACMQPPVHPDAGVTLLAKPRMAALVNELARPDPIRSGPDLAALREGSLGRRYATSLQERAGTDARKPECDPARSPHRPSKHHPSPALRYPTTSPMGWLAPLWQPMATGELGLSRPSTWRQVRSPWRCCWILWWPAQQPARNDEPLNPCWRPWPGVF